MQSIFIFQREQDTTNDDFKTSKHFWSNIIFSPTRAYKSVFSNTELVTTQNAITDTVWQNSLIATHSENETAHVKHKSLL